MPKTPKKAQNTGDKKKIITKLGNLIKLHEHAKRAATAQNFTDRLPDDKSLKKVCKQGLRAALNRLSCTELKRAEKFLETKAGQRVFTATQNAATVATRIMSSGDIKHLDKEEVKEMTSVDV